MPYSPLISHKLSNGRYVITSLIGVGGMAEVYEAQDTQLKRRVAIKILDREYANNPYYHRRFREEAEIAAHCDHPHIIKIYDIKQEGDIHYFVMQFLPKNLTSVLKTKKVLSPLEAVKILKPIAEALAYVHKKGIVHRDIKPNNIMFDEDNNPILTDFGIALRDDTTRIQGPIATGTPEYMSPEQIRGENLDFRSDIYSFGIVLYELVTGDVPYHSEDPQSVFYQHINEPLPEKPLKDNQVPRRVREILYKCLAKSPNDRFQSTQELVTALNDIILNPPTPKPIPSKKNLLTKKIIIPLFLLIFLLLFITLKLIPRFSSSSFFSAVSIHLLDSIAQRSISFPGEILLRIGEKETVFPSLSSKATIEFYSDRYEFNVNPSNSSLYSFKVSYPIHDTLMLFTLSAKVPYYEFKSVKESLKKGETTKVFLPLTPISRFCGQCGYEFNLIDTVCPRCGMARRKYPEER